MPEPLTPYQKKLRDPRWQRRRLEILKRDEFRCQRCRREDEELHVHHLDYEVGCEPWNYPDEWLLTLCKTCHELTTKERPDIERAIVSTLRIKFPFFDDLVSFLAEIQRAFDGEELVGYIEDGNKQFDKQWAESHARIAKKYEEEPPDAKGSDA